MYHTWSLTLEYSKYLFPAANKALLRAHLTLFNDINSIEASVPPAAMNLMPALETAPPP
jgi:hypothetical protein